MTNQIDSPGGKPRKDPSRPSPTLVHTDTAAERAAALDRQRAHREEGDEAAQPASPSKKPK